jgi:V/A-type H+-transporting ATPase subunit C
LPATFSQDDVFVFVKAYASRGTLFSRAFLEELANSRDLDELVAKLKATRYGELVGGLSGKMSARKLESAFRSSLSVFNFDLLRYYGKPALLQAYFERNLSWNLKVAIKGKATGLSYEDLSDVIVMKAEELSGRRDLIVRVLSATTLEQAVALLGDSGVRPYLDKALAAYRQSREISTFDLYIERYTLGKLVDVFRPRKGRLRRLYGRQNRVVRSIVALDVDSFDVLAILRSKWLEIPEAKAKELVITPAFALDAKLLDRMLDASTTQAAAAFLAHSPYRKMLPTTSSPEDLIGGIEDAFYRRMLLTAKRTFSSEPMSEPILLGALKAKEVEVRNLSTIAFGLEVGLQPSAITSKLVFS